MAQTSGEAALPFLAALGEHAKQHPKRKYRQLFETTCRKDVLQRVWALAAGNDGAPGIDGIGFATIEKGQEAWRGSWRGCRTTWRRESTNRSRYGA